MLGRDESASSIWLLGFADSAVPGLVQRPGGLGRATGDPGWLGRRRGRCGVVGCDDSHFEPLAGVANAGHKKVRLHSVQASEFIEGNHFDKYRSRHPIHCRLVHRFLTDCRDLVQSVTPHRVLEIGCGPGDLAQRALLRPGVEYVGTDLSQRQVGIAATRLPGQRFVVADAERLPFVDSFADLVVGCEVLEHLRDPERALAEIARVSKRFALLSVPWEPIWRILNVARGKYWSSFGNTPGHLQQFSRRAFRRLVTTRFRIIDQRSPFPWTMFLLEKFPCVPENQKRSPI